MKLVTAGLALAFALVATGCGGSQKQAAVPKGPSCADVGANVEKLFVEEGQKNGDDMTEIAHVTGGVVSDRCTADVWTPAAIACFSTATSEGMDACEKTITPAQKQAVEQAMQEKINAYAGQKAMEGAPPDSAPPDDPCGAGE